MKIKILKNTSPQAWYRDRIGETFEVLDTIEEHYVVSKCENWDKCVSFSDCEILSESTHETPKVSINKEKKEVCRVCGDELEDSDIEDLCRHCWIDQHGM